MAAPAGGHRPGPGRGYGNGFGQVWGYDTQRRSLTCGFQSPGPETLDFPDNVTTSSGTLVICEDSSGDNYLCGLTPGAAAGHRPEPAHQRGGTPRYRDEFAGSTYSHDGRTLFVNIQARAGMTFAIWGDWKKIGV